MSYRKCPKSSIDFLDIFRFNGNRIAILFRQIETTRKIHFLNFARLLLNSSVEYFKSSLAKGDLWNPLLSKKEDRRLASSYLVFLIYL